MKLIILLTCLAYAEKKQQIKYSDQQKGAHTRIRHFGKHDPMVSHILKLVMQVCYFVFPWRVTLDMKCIELWCFRTRDCSYLRKDLVFQIWTSLFTFCLRCLQYFLLCF